MASGVIHAVFTDNNAGRLTVAGGSEMTSVVITGDIKIGSPIALGILIQKLIEVQVETFPEERL